MKRLMIFALLTAVVWACRPDPAESIGPVYSTTDGLDGSWSLGEAIIIDESSPIKLERSYTEYFRSQAPSFEVAFNDDTREYTVQNEGTIRHFFGAGGNYAFDDEEYPTEIYLLPNATDTITMEFNRATRSIDPTLDISHKRSACDKVYANYKYVLSRN